MFDRLKRDFARFVALDTPKPSLANKIRVALKPQLHVIANYRFGRWTRANVRALPVRIPLVAVHRVLEGTFRLVWGMYIHGSADIGGGFYIGHPGFLLIGPCKIGQDCNLAPNTIIGQRTDGIQGAAVPNIGDRVWIGAGAVLFGGITVGDGVTIGPLTVVGRNVGPRSLVMGNPMKVLNSNHDNTRQIYGQTGAPEEYAPFDVAANETPMAQSGIARLRK